MKIEYNPQSDLLNIEFMSEVKVEESLEIDGVILDYAEDKRIVGIEVANASKRTTQQSLDSINVAISPANTKPRHFLY